MFMVRGLSVYLVLGAFVTAFLREYYHENDAYYYQ